MDALLTFDHAAHEYRLDGVRVPSVTQILAPLSNFDGVPAHVIEAKRALGSRVHRACELDAEGDLDEESIDSTVEPYLRAWRRFLRETGARSIATEQRVVEPTMRYAGTLDDIMLMGGTRVLIDKKTSFATPLAAGPQTAAYLRALGDPSVTHRAVLRLRPDGTYRFDPRDGPDDWSVFVACLTLHNFKDANQ